MLSTQSFFPAIIYFTSGVLLAFFGIQALIPLLRKRFLDDPNKPNSAHANPIPSGGGIVFVTITVLFGLLSLGFGSGSVFSGPGWLAWIPLISLPLAIVGMLDDYQGVSVWIRFGVQFLTASFLLLISPLDFPWLLFIPLLVSIVAVINFINFIDGMDGVLGASSFAFILASALSFVITSDSLKISSADPVSLYALMGALLGFLFWNWSPAKVFMGDVGSTFVGSVFIGYVLQQHSYASAVSLLLVSFTLLADAGGCVIRRIQYKQAILKPHKLMLYQRLNQNGWKHYQVAILYFVLTSFLAIVHLWGGLNWMLIAIVFESVILLWLDQRVAVRFIDSLRRSKSTAVLSAT
ncbi:MAG: glycosyl transferase [Synechococcaceae cyanobacterium]